MQNQRIMFRRSRPASFAQIFALSLAFCTFSIARNAHAEEVFWTTKALLSDFFKSSERVSYVKLDAARAGDALVGLLGYRAPKASYVVFVARTGSRIDGYAIVDEEMGQHLPITFGVKISPNGGVERFEVMVYREGYGGEIREQRFRRQFEGKKAADGMRFGDDIVAVSGATISSKAMAIGVRRAAAVVEIVKRLGLDVELMRSESPAPANAEAATAAR
jgi:Na+-translocating ferredoxin:NAD+ oxidoreductase subunit G